MEDNSIDIEPLQDAHCDERGTLPDFSMVWKIFTSCKRSAYLVVRNTSLIINHLYTGDHRIFIKLSTAEGELTNGPTYLAFPLKTSIKPLKIGNT